MYFHKQVLCLTFLSLGLSLQATAQDCHQRLDPIQTQGSGFGGAVAIEGSTLIVCAPNEGQSRGAFHAYRENSVTKAYRFVATFTASDASNSDDFGESIAMDGDRLVVGAPNADGGVGNLGQAYVFERAPGTDDWVEQAILFPTVPELQDGYGQSVALDGDRLVVGAGNGSLVYCYEYDPQGGLWNETQVLQLSGAGTNPYFGRAVSMSAGRLLVGAWNAYVNQIRGMALVYAIDPGTGLWVEQERLQPGTTPIFSGNFGRSVALQGDRALVGYPTRNSGGVSGAGAGYLYEWDSMSATWGLAQLLEPGAPTFGANMGELVTLDGDRVSLGAPLHPLPGNSRRGVIHRYNRDNGSGLWVEEPTFPLPLDLGRSNFPRSLAQSGQTVAAGNLTAAVVIRADSPDCNNNGIGDLCEVSAGTVEDLNGNFVPDSCESIGFSYCGPGALNTTGLPSQTFALGNGLTTDPDFTLFTIDVPNNQFAYYLVSMGTTIVQQPAGSQGDLCIAGAAIGRFNQTENILFGSGNRVSLDVDLSALPQPTGPVSAMAGETWYFQLWHRDFVTVSTSNFSDARGITFQ